MSFVVNLVEEVDLGIVFFVACERIWRWSQEHARTDFFLRGWGGRHILFFLIVVLSEC